MKYVVEMSHVVLYTVLFFYNDRLRYSTNIKGIASIVLVAEVLALLTVGRGVMNYAFEMAQMTRYT
jgi:hypothetical protein